MKNLIIFSITILCLSSCKTANILMESKEDQKLSVSHLDSAFYYNPHYQYTIKEYDKISVSVWGEDNLSVGSIYGIYNSNEVYGKWLMVDLDGNVEMPRLGTLNILGKTLIEVKQILKKEHSEWLVNAIVDVKILNKEITVLGEVINPQVIHMDKDQLTLLEVIARCQGFDEYANMRYIKILRQEGQHVMVANIDITQSGDYLKKNIQIHPGDFIIVPSKTNKVFDKRISTVIPFASTATAAAIILGAF